MTFDKDFELNLVKYAETVAEYHEDFENNQGFFDFMYEDKTFVAVEKEWGGKE